MISYIEVRQCDICGKIISYSNPVHFEINTGKTILNLGEYDLCFDCRDKMFIEQYDTIKAFREAYKDKRTKNE